MCVSAGVGKWISEAFGKNVENCWEIAEIAEKLQKNCANFRNNCANLGNKSFLLDEISQFFVILEEDSLAIFQGPGFDQELR